MNTEQRQAYGWAKTHDYPSIAARYARALVSAVDDLEAQLAESQRRERAAVEQIEQQMIFDAKKGCEPCEICSNADKTPCEECNPKWRGPQEVEKGDAPNE